MAAHKRCRRCCENPGLDADDQLESFTEQQILELKEAFALFDKKGTGHVTSKDLGTVMRSLGQRPSEAELEEMILACDPSGRGDITFDNFLDMMVRKLQSDDDGEADIERIFQIFDKDGDGYINYDDLSGVMKDLGEELTDDEIRDMMHQADTSHDGKIDYQEFMSLMMSL
uniref:Calmodulin n=1 Tax=Lotharella oceanica TaxID=641309 RepID=A0A7S2U3J4_9EUKA